MDIGTVKRILDMTLDAVETAEFIGKDATRRILVVVEADDELKVFAAEPDDVPGVLYLLEWAKSSLMHGGLNKIGAE